MKIANISLLLVTGTKGIKDFKLVKKIYLVNYASLLFIVAAIPFNCVLIFLGYFELSYISIPFVLMYGSCFILNKLKYFITAKVCLNIAIIIPLFIYAMVLGKDAGIQYVNLTLITLSFGIFKENEKVLRTIFSIIPFLLFYLLYYLYYIDVNISYYSKMSIDPTHINIIYLTSLSIIFTIIYMTVKAYCQDAEKYKRKIDQLLSVYNITQREKDIVLKLVEGKANKKIAKELFIEESTVKNHLNSIFRKTKMSNRLELMSILCNAPS